MSNITDHRIISHEDWIARQGKANKARAEQLVFRSVYIAPRWGARPYKVKQTAARH